MSSKPVRLFFTKKIQTRTKARKGKNISVQLMINFNCKIFFCKKSHMIFIIINDVLMDHNFSSHKTSPIWYSYIASYNLNKSRKNRVSIIHVNG